MSQPRFVLSVFPGIGLLDRAFEAEGFTVVRGPDVLWGGDVRTFKPPSGIFDGVVGGPPCQSFSSLANLVRARGYEPRYGNLIPEFERVVWESRPRWFLMENVRKAPVPEVPGYAVVTFLWDNCWLGEEQRRLRRFSFGVLGTDAVDPRRWMAGVPLMLPVAAGAVVQTHINNSDEAKGRAVTGTVAYKPAPGQRRPTRMLLPPVTAGAQEARARPGVQVPAVLGARTSRPVRLGGSGKPKPGVIMPAVLASDGGQRRPGGSFLKPAVAAPHSAIPDRKKGGGGSRGGALAKYRLPEACRLQGLPEDFLKHAPFTADGKLRAVAQGVPLALGRALARAVLEAAAELDRRVEARAEEERRA